MKLILITASLTTIALLLLSGCVTVYDETKVFVVEPVIIVEITK